MNLQQAASALDNNQYREEGNKELFKQMKESGIVAVFGASDDLIEFRGAIYDECGAPGIVLINNKGLYTSCCDNEDCPHEEKRKYKFVEIEAFWCQQEDFCWTYETFIPHETFVIKEDDSNYCRGIVFYLADAEHPL